MASTNSNWDIAREIVLNAAPGEPTVVHVMSDAEVREYCEAVEAAGDGFPPRP